MRWLAERELAATEPYGSEFAEQRDEDLRLLDRLCDAFEAAWRAGASPAVEDYLAECPPAVRARLLRELLPLDLEYYGERGDCPREESYLRRFPEFAEAVRAAFDGTTHGPQAPCRAESDSRRAEREMCDELPPDTVLSARYVVAELLGRGGMGVVYRARDVDLQRPLAVKVMRGDLPCDGETPREPSNQDTPSSKMERRFWEEARVTGQLQHPGIPPVHEVGRLSDGRPFIAMKLIEGRTLARMLGERPSPRHDLPSYLKIFEQVAQTLAYSHAQGVIHRDLKPANIMVGAFGEVQVMDWGLAMRLRSEDAVAQPSALLRTPAGDHAERPAVLTDADSSLALAADTTRTHLPPSFDGEQGRLTQAGQVMGTLAYMPPEQARGQIEALDQRSDVFGLGAILLTILTGAPPYAGGDVRDVLAAAASADLAEAWRRLDASGADAELAALVRECLAERPLDRPCDAGAVAARVSQHLASVQERLKAAEVQSAADQARIAEERKRRRVTIALAACGLVLIGGIALVAVRNHEQRLEMEARTAAVERDAGAILHAQTAALAQLQLELGDPGTCQALVDEPLRWQAALDAVAAELERAKVLMDGAPEAVDDQLPRHLAELQSELTIARADKDFVVNLEAIRQADSIRVKDKWTQASVLPKYEAAFQSAGFAVPRDDPAALEKLAERVRASAIRWPLVTALDHWAAVAREQGHAAVDRLLRLARGADPHPFRDRFRDIDAWSNQQALARLAADPQALEQSPQFIEALAWVYSNNFGDAKPLLRAAIARHPRDFWLLFRMGLIAPTPVEQAGYFRAALAIRPESSAAFNNLGNALLEDDYLEDGRACYQRAHELDPDNADVVYNLGRVLSLMKRHAEANIWYDLAARLDSDPSFVAMLHTARGLDLREQDRLDEAVSSYERALSLNPKYALAHNNLGLAYKAQGKLDQARACYEQAIAHDPKLAMAHTNLGKLLHEQGKTAEATACYKRALELDPRYADAHLSLGVALKDQKLLHEAVAAYRTATAIKPRSALAHRNLGLALYQLGKLDEAERSFRTATELDPADVTARHNLGSALKELGRLDEAAACYRATLELDPKHASAYLNLGNVLRLQNKPHEGLACFQRFVELKPDDAEGYHSIGSTIFPLGQVEEAIAQYRKALELKPDFALAWYNLGVALDGQGRIEETIAAYRRAIELDPRHADAHRNLGLLLKHDGRFAEALTLLERGQELGANTPVWQDPNGDAARDCRRMLEAEALLPRAMSGEVEASAAQLLALADLCRKHKKQYAAALKFHRAAFAAEPALLDEIASARYNAACAAVMLADGLGEDKLVPAGGQSEDAARAELRQQALAWLSAEIAAYRRVLEGNKPDEKQMVPIMLRHLPRDETLSSVRDPSALANLTPEEQAAWRDFWRQVKELGDSPKL